MKRHSSLLILGILVVSILGCGGNSEDSASPASSPSDESAEPASQSGDETAGFAWPKDPFFKEFACPNATPDDKLTMGGATSVWLKTTDDMTKVATFYSEKFATGNNVVEQERAYFTKQADGKGYGATVTKQPDSSVQIILTLEAK